MRNPGWRIALAFCGIVAGAAIADATCNREADRPAVMAQTGPIEIDYRNELIPLEGAEPVDFGPFVVWPMFTNIPAQTLETESPSTTAWIREPSDYPKSRLVVTPPAGWEAISFNGATKLGEPTTVLRVWQAEDGRQVGVALSEAEEESASVMPSSERTRLALIDGNYAVLETNIMDPEGVRGGIVTLFANGAQVDVFSRGDPRPTLGELAVLAGQIARLLPEE